MKIIGLKLIKKNVIKNKKGDIIKYISRNDKFFKKFGEVYFTEILKNKTKGWNFHKRNSCLISVPFGKVKFTFVDGRKNSKSYNKKLSCILGKKSYKIIIIPARIWFSFKSISKISLVANCLNNPHSNIETLKKNKVKNIEIKN